LYAPKRQQIQVEVEIDPDAAVHKIEAAKAIETRAAELFPVLASTRGTVALSATGSSAPWR
jgi:hypothetical protein